MSSLGRHGRGPPPARVAELQRDGAQLVDVREPYEREAGRIAGRQLPHRAGPAHRARPSRSTASGRWSSTAAPGSRSALAAQAFSAAGYDAHNLDGGLKAWVKDGLPIEPADGRVA